MWWWTQITRSLSPLYMLIWQSPFLLLQARYNRHERARVNHKKITCQRARGFNSKMHNFFTDIFTSLGKSSHATTSYRIFHGATLNRSICVSTTNKVCSSSSYKSPSVGNPNNPVALIDLPFLDYDRHPATLILMSCRGRLVDERNSYPVKRYKMEGLHRSRSLTRPGAQISLAHSLFNGEICYSLRDV